MTARGIPVGRILGIEIRIAPAWAVLLALVMLIAAEQAGVSGPQVAVLVQWVIGAVVAMAFLASVIAHEMAHALLGRHLGMEAREVVLGFVGGPAPLPAGAARPRDELSVALVGPFVSLVIAFVAMPVAILAWLAEPALGTVAGALMMIGVLNLILGLVSLLPGIPLDGGRAVLALAWAHTGDPDRAGRIAARVGRLLGMATFALGALLTVAGRASEGLLIVCLGWLLVAGARSLDRRLALETLLRGMVVGDALNRDVPRVAPNLTVDTFASRYEGQDALSALPVVDDDRVIGVIGRKRLKRLGRGKFAATRALDIMDVPPQAPILAPGDSLWGAALLMNERGMEGLAVAVDGRLEGLLTAISIGEVVRRLAAPAPIPSAAAGPAGGGVG